MRVNYAIVFVSDMSRSVAFYRDTLEIPLKFESPGWSEFLTEGSTLALHIADEAAGDLLQGEVAGQCRWGFQVSDLGEFHATMIEKEVPCAQPPTETFGVKIAQYVDPDGMVFSVGESQDAP